MNAVLASFLASRAGHLADISAAAQGGDLPALERAAHRLKGALSTIRAPAGTAISAALEQAASTSDHAVLSGLQAELEVALCVLADVLEAV